MRIRLPRLLMILLPVLLLLSSCSTTPEEEPYPLAGRAGGYETSANISYKELQATAQIVQGFPNSCSLTFSSPESLQDLSFVFRQDTVDISYRGLSYTVDPSTLPGGAVAGVTVSAINRAISGSGMTVGYEEDAFLLTGMLESGEFSLRLDGASGNLVKLSIPSEELEIEFVNFRFLD